LVGDKDIWLVKIISHQQSLKVLLWEDFRYLAYPGVISGK